MRAARRLRGHSTRGLRSIARLAVPVMAGALDRSLDLAASMESRGYGRAVHRTDASRRGASAMTLVGLLGILVGLYGLLDASTPPLLGLPLVLAGAVLAGLALLVGARRETRSRYRRDPWALPEWLVSLAGLLPAVVLVVATQQAGRASPRSRCPPRCPALPLPAVLAIGVRRARRRRRTRPAAAGPPAGRRGEDLMIEFHDVSIRYEGDDRDRLRTSTSPSPRASWSWSSGRPAAASRRCCACINGLVPHFSGGRLSGSVVVAGRDTRTHRPRDLADLVGVVVQDPVASFVTDTVEEEIAYGMEAMGVEADRDAPAGRGDPRPARPAPSCAAGRCSTSPAASSSGSRSRAVLAAGPRILVLDEPTSALDPVAAEEVLAALHRLVHDLGITVVLAEHRLERVIHHADRVVLVGDGRTSPLLEPGRGDAHLSDLPPGHRPGPAPPAGRRCRCRCGTPAAAPSALRDGARPRAPRHPRPRLRRRAPRRRACGSSSCDAAPVDRAARRRPRPRRAAA